VGGDVVLTSIAGSDFNGCAAESLEKGVAERIADAKK